MNLRHTKLARSLFGRALDDPDRGLVFCDEQLLPGPFTNEVLVGEFFTNEELVGDLFTDERLMPADADCQCE
jgi:hypothetical protein